MSTPRVGAAVAALLLAGVAIWRFRQGRKKRALLASTGALVLILLASGGTLGVPDGETAVDRAADFLDGWLYPFAIAMAFFESSIPPITLVYPGEWGLMLCGSIAGAGRADIVPLLLIAWLVSAAGDSVTFVLGRKLGRPFLHRVGLSEQRLAKVDAWFERFGPAAVCIGRLLPLARPFGPFLAGSSHLAYRRFLPWNVLGCLLFALVFCGLGYLFYNSYDELTQTAGQVGLGILVVAVAAALAVRDLRRRRAVPAEEGAL